MHFGIEGRSALIVGGSNGQNPRASLKLRSRQGEHEQA